jgi:hypothetical protein
MPDVTKELVLGFYRVKIDADACCFIRLVAP